MRDRSGQHQPVYETERQGIHIRSRYPHHTRRHGRRCDDSRVCTSACIIWAFSQVFLSLCEQLITRVTCQCRHVPPQKPVTPCAARDSCVWCGGGQGIIVCSAPASPTESPDHKVGSQLAQRLQALARR